MNRQLCLRIQLPVQLCLYKKKKVDFECSARVVEGVFPAVCVKLLKSSLSHHWNILHNGASWNSPATALRAEREERFYLQLQLTLPFVSVESAQGEMI